MIPCQAKTCQWGVMAIVCGAPSTTKRQRPAGGETWDICDEHAASLDRLRANVREHSALLKRLRDA